MNDHGLDKFLDEHYLSNLFDPNAKTLGNYYDEDLKRDLWRFKKRYAITLKHILLDY